MGKKKRKNNTAKSSDETNKYTVEDLLKRVNEYIENFEFELAAKFCEKAIMLDPENTSTLETFGTICAEVGDVDNAVKHFQKAVELDPNKGHVKYLYLGQLTEGKLAVEYYEKAVGIMKSEIEFQKNNANSENMLSDKDLSSVYCSLAEIYLTDCCMEENAEDLCEKYCKDAISVDDTRLEAIVVMCNFLLSKDNTQEAQSYAEKGFEVWQQVSSKAVDNIPDVIDYEARVSLIKLLIEVQCYDKVSVIVDQLIEENEDDIRIWYYLGLAKCLLKDTDNPRFYLEKALELIEKCEDDDDDETMKDHINELLQGCPLDDMETIEEEESADDGEHNGMDVE